MNDNHIFVSAPGKVILFGEHAVVYGKPAIAASIDLRTTVTIEPSNKQCISLCLQNLNKTFEWSLDDLQRIFPEIIFSDRRSHYMPLPPQLSCLDAITQLIGQDKQDLESARDAAKVFLYYISSFMHENKRFIPIDVCVSSNLPIGAGLGSSASYSINLVTGMLLAVGSISCSSQRQENSETFQEHSVAKDLAGHPLENERDILVKPCKN